VEEYIHVNPDITKFKEYTSLAIDSKDNIYVSAQSSILIFNKALKKARRIKTEEPAYCIEVGNDSLIYAGFKNYVMFFNRAGELLNTLKFDNKKTIITAICNTENYIFVADAGTRNIKRF